MGPLIYLRRGTGRRRRPPVCRTREPCAVPLGTLAASGPQRRRQRPQRVGPGQRRPQRPGQRPRRQRPGPQWWPKRRTPLGPRRRHHGAAPGGGVMRDRDVPSPRAPDLTAAPPRHPRPAGVGVCAVCSRVRALMSRQSAAASVRASSGTSRHRSPLTTTSRSGIQTIRISSTERTTVGLSTRADEHGVREEVPVRILSCATTRGSANAAGGSGLQ